LYEISAICVNENLWSVWDGRRTSDARQKARHAEGTGIDEGIVIAAILYPRLWR
jgi:hypothetical protein